VLRKVEQHTRGTGARHGFVHVQGPAGRPPNRRAVKLARHFLIGSVLLALPPAASAAPDAGSGGALAQPLSQGEGGGARAPEHEASPAASESGGGGAAVAGAARDEPPRWQTEPPEPEWSPYPGVAQQTVGEAAGDAAEIQTAAGEGTAAAEDAPAAGKSTAGKPAAGSSLPWTGLEVAALAAIGLGLLTLGAALRPRRATQR
jgi:hypothetical protein